jgi:hypothetical protein
MGRQIYLAIACDTDPDRDIRFRVPDTARDVWSGCRDGISALRKALAETGFCRTHGQLPVTWLLRADRQIAEVYGDAAYCWKTFAGLWEREVRLGSEIGWHPHLYRWRDGGWFPYLHQTDDLEVLGDCLAALREHSRIRAVRTGWDYQSNRLLAFFDAHEIEVDASALPGCVWRVGSEIRYDWQGTRRQPYFPSKADYRSPGQPSLAILSVPSLVRRLNLRKQCARYGLRAARALRSCCLAPLTEWETARWQGVMMTYPNNMLREAAAQTMAGRDTVFLTTYFHTTGLAPETISRFMENLDAILAMAEFSGYELIPMTLTGIGNVFKSKESSASDRIPKPRPAE